MDKKDIKGFSPEGLKVEMRKISEPAYRAKQILFWLYKKGVNSFNAMGNIPKPLKDKLDSLYSIGNIQLYKRLVSTDKTEKFLFKLSDGNFIETVLIYAGGRKTLCLSTQVGCRYRCCFCASGLKGFIRNLTPSEITNQILFLQHTFKHKITNLVFMGMGEPLDNYENVSSAIMIINSPEGIGIAARRITVSTSGIIPGIEKLKNLGLQINLSISLHAANNKLRDGLMPVNKKYPVGELIKACQDYINTTGRILTLEYVLIKDKNDSEQNAEELAAIAKKLKAKVNLIPYSNICGFNLKAPQEADIEIFMNRLKSKRVSATLRESKGKDIQAACGQLAGMISG